MLSFEQALESILKNTKKLGIKNIAIENSPGRILMEDIYSKLDMPPFNKSAMDGYAVYYDDIKKIPAKLKCVGLIQAGEIFRKKIKPGECVKIMTGASLPADTDSVVVVEDTRQSEDYVEILKGVKKGRNICVKGEDIQTGQKVFSKGTKIHTSHISALASIGKSSVKVIKKPAVAILNTGGEIVPLGKNPGKNKIYNSNGPQLSSLLQSDGFTPYLLGIAKDDPKILKNKIREGLKKDVLLVSGGVSMGDYDLVPSAFESSGIKKIFHKVKVKPGRPLFFGTMGQKLIFGIPGNPVSNFLAYLTFIRPALLKMMGYSDYTPCFQKGLIKRDFYKKSGRKHFIPVKIFKDRADYYLDPLNSHGSADILTFSRADGFMILEDDESFIKANSQKEFITWK